MRRGLGGLVLALALVGFGVSAQAAGRRVEVAAYRPIGGLDQWVTIRGDDNQKPLLLVVHGGPGDAQSPFADAYAPYQNDFVVVQWDQRGAGRTFAKSGAKTPDMTMGRSIDDGIALAEALHRQFPKNRLIVMGHSYGSAIATGMVQKRRDLFTAYVGTGQIASWAAGAYYQFDFLKEAARKAGDAPGLAALEAIGRPDPLDITQYFTFTRPLRSRMNPSDTAWITGMKARAMSNGETEGDIKGSADGQGFSGQALIQEIVRVDLAATATTFKLPYCVIQGRADLNTPTAPAKAYFDKVQAPRKRFAVIEDAGHFALVTHQASFLSELKKCPGVR